MAVMNFDKWQRPAQEHCHVLEPGRQINCLDICRKIKMAKRHRSLCNTVHDQMNIFRDVDF